MVWAALDRGAESRGWWGPCHSPSRVIGSRCEAAWPLRQKGVRAALKAQRRADGIAGTQTNPCSQPKKNRIPHCAADHWASIGALPYSSTSGRYMPNWQTTTKLFLVKLPLFIYKTSSFTLDLDSSPENIRLCYRGVLCLEDYIGTAILESSLFFLVIVVALIVNWQVMRVSVSSSPLFEKVTSLLHTMVFS